MKILILNQAFHPDVVSTAQHASDLAVRLCESGHQVTVIASSFGYDNPQLRFPRRETWRGVEVHRVSMLRLGKSSRWRRAFSFASYLVNCFARMLLLPRHDLVISLTSPPLISALGAFLVRLKGGKFVSWVMDLNPDEAIAAGWLRADSQTGRLLSRVLDFSLNHSHRLIALDRFMAHRLAAKGISHDKIAVIPPWSHDVAVSHDPAGRHSFRRAHNLENKFVVMYSGNHSPIHPLDTLLDAAHYLRDHPDIVFCFAGGGSEFPKIRAQAEAGLLPNVRCIPYQPIDKLSASLSAADLHVVVMGDPFVGIVHPCKVYNIRRLGIPFVYIGPAPSHVTELNPAAQFRHGDSRGVEEFIRQASTGPVDPSPPPFPDLHSQQFRLDQMREVIQSVLIDEKESAPDLPGSSLLAP